MKGFFVIEIIILHFSRSFLFFYEIFRRNEQNNLFYFQIKKNTKF